jgi:hypothetical protein
MTTPKLTGNRCQCPTCSEYFNGVQPFDKHRIGDYAKPGQPNTRRCLTVTELEAAGFIRNAAGFWCERAGAERATRPRAHGFSAPRMHAAMVQPTPARDAHETRVGALP